MNYSTNFYNIKINNNQNTHENQIHNTSKTTITFFHTDKFVVTTIFNHLHMNGVNAYNKKKCKKKTNGFNNNNNEKMNNEYKYNITTTTTINNNSNTCACECFSIVDNKNNETTLSNCCTSF